MTSVSQSRSKIQRTAQERFKRYSGEQAIKGEFDNHTNRMIHKDKPKPLRTHDMAAAASSGGGFAGVRPGRDGSADRQDERESQGEITVSVADGAIVLEIEHLDDLVVVELDPGSVVNLIASLGLALSEVRGGEE